MQVDLSTLPEDVQRYIKQLQAEKESYKKLYEDLKQDKYGTRSEKLRLGDDEQSRLFNEPEHEAAQVESATVVKSHRRSKRRKKIEPKPVIPAGLTEKVIRHELTAEEKECPCCSKEMRLIGEDAARELHIIPEQLIVHRHVYPKYACSSCKEETAVVSAKRNRFLPGTIVGSGLLAYILQRKYQFALPLYRISSMFKTFQVDVSRQTMANWILNAAQKLKPFYDLLQAELLHNPLLALDETPMQVLNEKDRKDTAKSYMWHLRSGTNRPVAWFGYRSTRSTKFLEPLLKDYGGTILTDGYPSYDSLASSLKLAHAGCWSHARRYFHKVLQAEPENNDAIVPAGKGL